MFAPYMPSWDGAIVPLLTFSMLCMGLTLEPADFDTVAGYKRALWRSTSRVAECGEIVAAYGWRLRVFAPVFSVSCHSFRAALKIL